MKITVTELSRAESWISVGNYIPRGTHVSSPAEPPDIPCDNDMVWDSDMICHEIVPNVNQRWGTSIVGAIGLATTMPQLFIMCANSLVSPSSQTDH